MSATAKAIMEPKLLRILCLHGYRQNEKMFRERTGGLKKVFKKYAELVYCEAPHDVPQIATNESDGTETAAVTLLDDESASSKSELTQATKGWWLKSREWPNADLNEDFATTLRYIDHVCETQGPFDGLLGFSQGGIVVSILCSIVNSRRKGLLPPDVPRYDHIDFRFVIIAAASQSWETKHDVYYTTGPFDIPSLHIIGQTDKLVAPEKAQALTRFFVAPTLFCHELGHCMPNKPREPYIDFLTTMQRQYNVESG